MHPRSKIERKPHVTATVATVCYCRRNLRKRTSKQARGGFPSSSPLKSRGTSRKKLTTVDKMYCKHKRRAQHCQLGRSRAEMSCATNPPPPRRTVFVTIANESKTGETPYGQQTVARRRIVHFDLKKHTTDHRPCRGMKGGGKGARAGEARLFQTAMFSHSGGVTCTSIDTSPNYSPSAKRSRNLNTSVSRSFPPPQGFFLHACPSFDSRCPHRRDDPNTLKHPHPPRPSPQPAPLYFCHRAYLARPPIKKGGKTKQKKTKHKRRE